jgi:hypothetical protein
LRGSEHDQEAEKRRETTPDCIVPENVWHSQVDPKPFPRMVDKAMEEASDYGTWEGYFKSWPKNTSFSLQKRLNHSHTHHGETLLSLIAALTIFNAVGGKVGAKLTERAME